MSEPRKPRVAPAGPAAPPARTGRTALLPPLDRGAVARGGTWWRGGTLMVMPLRTRLALVRPRMLKAQGRMSS
jgi:hypothetical protein